MLNFSLFRIPSFRNGNLAALIVSMGEFGILPSLALCIQNVLRYDALQTGFLRLGIAVDIVGLVILALSIGVGTPWWAIAGARRRRARRA
jgi:hypothetical protein